MNLESYRRWGLRLTTTILLLLLPGCVSVQLPTAGGRPQVVGFGRGKPLAVKQGEIYRITAPGLSLRLHTFAPGLSLGWSETDLFFTDAENLTNRPVHPVAIRNRLIGINLAPWQVVVGYDQSFAICPPPENETKGMIQFVQYSENNEIDTIIQRKEKP